MIEILILYSVYRRERTLYGIRKEIIDIFGAYTKPSVGTLHPALKKLTVSGDLTCIEKFSDGGKKSSYYGITHKGQETFKKLFISEISDNPSLFYNQIQICFAAMGLLSVDERKEYLEEIRKKVDLYIIDIQNRLNDEYLGLDYFQRQIMARTLSELKSLLTYMKQLKVENDG